MRRTQALILWWWLTPTNYDPDTNRFDTRAVDTVVDAGDRIGKDALVVIKSTVPVGHTQGFKGYAGPTGLSFFRQSFCERARHYTTTYIHPESSWVAQRS